LGKWMSFPHLGLDNPRFVPIADSAKAGVLDAGFPAIILVQKEHSKSKRHELFPCASVPTPGLLGAQEGEWTW
jgi:hypothetical protein